VIHAVDWERDEARAAQKAAETHPVLGDLIFFILCR
jgi:hypothetical protein